MKSQKGYYHSFAAVAVICDPPVWTQVSVTLWFYETKTKKLHICRRVGVTVSKVMMSACIETNTHYGQIIWCWYQISVSGEPEGLAGEQLAQMKVYKTSRCKMVTILYFSISVVHSKSTHLFLISSQEMRPSYCTSKSHQTPHVRHQMADKVSHWHGTFSC